MDNKAFLHITDYPKVAGDMPVEILIDWNDGTSVEQHIGMRLVPLPVFTHFYADNDPHTIGVTLKNSCGEEHREIEFTPFTLSECSCPNTYTFNPASIVTNFDPELFDMFLEGCVVDVLELESGLYEMLLTTDVSSNLPLCSFPPTYRLLQDGVFALQNVIPPRHVVENLRAHVEGGVFSVVNEAALDFVYTFDPVNVGVLRVRGDTNFRERLGDSITNAGVEEPLNWEQISGSLWQVEIPVGVATNVIRLSLAAGRRANYVFIVIEDEYQQPLAPHQIEVCVCTFVSRESVVTEFDLRECENNPTAAKTWMPQPDLPNIEKWRTDIASHAPITNGAILEIPIAHPGTGYSVEFDFWWSLGPTNHPGYGTYGAFFYLSAQNAVLQPNQPNSGIYRQTERKRRRSGTASFRTPIRGTQGGTFLLYANNDNQYGYNDTASCQVELRGINYISPEFTVITGGMAGTLLYKSDTIRRIERVEIVCDATAKERLTTVGFVWDSIPEETGFLEFWRGAYTFSAPVFIDTFTLEFSGTDGFGALLPNGIINKLEFFEVPEHTTFDSPITVRMAVLGDTLSNAKRNIQNGIFYYEKNGRYHCTATNVLHLTKNELNHLVFEPVIHTAVRLTTSLGSAFLSSSGEVNPMCVPLLAFTPVTEIMLKSSYTIPRANRWSTLQFWEQYIYMEESSKVGDITVSPDDATIRKPIIWEVTDVGTTAVQLGVVKNNYLYAGSNAGIITLSARISRGAGNADFVQEGIQIEII